MDILLEVDIICICNRQNIKMPLTFSKKFLGYPLSFKRIWQAYKKVKWFSFIKLFTSWIEIESGNI